MRNILRTISNSMGISIIQALVGSFIASIVALGVSTMLVNSQIQTRKIQLMNTLNEQKMKIEFLLRDQNAFSQTINNNTSALFTKLKASSAVTEMSYASGAVELVIYDAAGIAVYDMLGPVASGLTGAGITEKGSPCTGFNATSGSGNDDCPISYRILVAADCPGSATTCLDPQLKIVARMIFNPSSSGSSQLNKFINLFPQRDWSNISSNSIDDTVEDGKYDVAVKRTASSVAKGFQLSVYHPNNITPGPALAYGGCRTTWGMHDYLSTTGWTEDYDPHDLVTPNSGGSGRVVFNNPAGYGSYNCTITAPAFAVGPFSIKFYNISTAVDVALGTSVAPQWAEATARIEASFNVANSNAYSVYFRCDSVGGAPEWALGVSRAPYGPDFPMVVMKCSKVDTVF